MDEPRQDALLQTTITGLSLSVQQLSMEAKELRQTVTKNRDQRNTTAVLVLLAIIAISVASVALHVLFS